MIPQELVNFLDAGVSVVVGTRDASLMPECTRAWGIRVEPDHASVTLFLTESISRKTLENLRDNGQISVTCSMPTTHQACQLKGVFRRARPLEPADQAYFRHWFEKFKLEIGVVGVRTDGFDALYSQPVLAVEVRVTDIFSQTPGPRAGARI